MKKETLKMLGILGMASFVGAGYASANMETCPNAMFTAKNCETQRISIGGLLSANYQWAELDDNTRRDADLDLNRDDPDHFNNFYMKYIRLMVRADLCDSWSAFMSIDFAGKDTIRYNTPNEFRTNDGGLTGATTIRSSFQCSDRLPIFVDRAYIEKRWCAAVFRAGYQKVNFGAEEVIPDEYVKTINRSVATNFFMNLGRRAVVGTYVPGLRNYRFGGNRFADRHVGLYLQGDACESFHYNLAIVNGYQGLCRNSTHFNNELGYFAGIAYENCVCGTDILIGVNAGYKPYGGRWNDLVDEDEDDNIFGTRSSATWGVNPYILGNWNCLSVLAEILYGGIEHGQLTHRGTANPWGFNLIPSYMLNDCWELVGRFSYLNTNKSGTSIDNAFGPAPDNGKLGVAANTFIASEAQFNKVTSLYAGINYYTVNQAVKASLGYEWARFKHLFVGTIGAGGAFNNQHATVQAVRAQLQIMF